MARRVAWPGEKRGVLRIDKDRTEERKALFERVLKEYRQLPQRIQNLGMGIGI